jgi:hypothetical protein
MLLTVCDYYLYVIYMSELRRVHRDNALFQIALLLNELSSLKFDR